MMHPPDSRMQQNLATKGGHCSNTLHLLLQHGAGRGMAGPLGAGGTVTAPFAMAYPGMLGLPQVICFDVGIASVGLSTCRLCCM